MSIKGIDLLRYQVADGRVLNPQQLAAHDRGYRVQQFQRALDWGTALYTVDGLAHTLDDARQAIAVLAPLRSWEHVVCDAFRVQLSPDPDLASYLAVRDSTIRSYGDSLARLFAADAAIVIRCTARQPDWCDVVAYDPVALRRGQCRQAVLTLLSRRLFPGLPRDMRTMLGRLVWDTRRESFWDKGSAEKKMKSDP
jgi:hypothetical protein